MAFPSSPQINDVYVDETSNTSFVWDGDKWVTTGEGAAFVAGPPGATGPEGPIGATGPSPTTSLITDIVDDTAYPPPGGSDQGGLTFVFVENVAGDTTEPLLKDAAGISFNPDGNEFAVNTISTEALNILNGPGMYNTGGNVTIGITTVSLLDATDILTYTETLYGRVPNAGSNSDAGSATNNVVTNTVGYADSTGTILTAGSGFSVAVVENLSFCSIITVDVSIRYVTQDPAQSSDPSDIVYDQFTFINTGFNANNNSFAVKNKINEDVNIGSLNPADQPANYISSPNIHVSGYANAGVPIVAVVSKDSFDGVFIANLRFREISFP